MTTMLLLWLTLTSGMGLPLGLPPGLEDPVVANAAPEECLFYLSWAGTAKPDPKSSNHLEQLIAEPEVQQFSAGVERSIREGLRAAAARNEPEAAPLVDDLVGLVKTALTSPGAVYLGKLDIGREPRPRIQAGAVFNLGDDAAKARTLLEKYRKLLGEDDVKTVQIGGETFYRITPDPYSPVATWGVHGKHFVVGIGEGEAEAIVKRMTGSPPAWLAQVRRRLTVQRPATVTYVNVKKFVGMIEVSFPTSGEWQLLIRALGLHSFTFVANVSGLDSTGFVSRTLLATEKDAGDVLSFLGRKPLEVKDLAPIPKDATLALAARFDAGRFWEMLFGLLKDLPQVGDSFGFQMAETEKGLGFRIREDLLQSLGDVWCIYNSPGEGGLVLTGLTAVVPLKDPERAAAANAKLLAFWNISAVAKAAREDAGPRFRGGAPLIRHFRFADRTVFTLDAPEMDLPFAPSWCLTDRELIVALFPQNVKAYLSRGADFQSLAAVPDVAGLFRAEDGPVAVGYQDTPELFRLIYPIAQIAAKFILGELRREGIDVDVSLLPSAASISKHLRPSVKAVRRTKDGIEVTVRHSLPGCGAAALVPMAGGLMWFRASAGPIGPPPTARLRSANNLKQIGLAMHTHIDVFKTFPPAYTVDKNGKPLLSWRVAILPYLEQSPLYDQFHLGEPWDSEHNKQLIARMPEVYRAPGSKAGPGKTNYLTVRGKDTIFPGAEKISFAQIRDGSSNTIMAVEAADPSAVEWTRPGDFVPDPKQPAKGLVGLRPGGFLAVFADGSVHFLPASADPEKLKALFTRAGNDVVDLDDLSEPLRRPPVKEKASRPGTP